MKNFRWLGIVALALTFGCQAPSPALVTVLDGGRSRSFTASGPLIPSSLVLQAGFTLGPGDAVLVRGYPVEPGTALPPAASITLQIERSMNVLISGKAVRTTAGTVGEVLAQEGIEIYGSDRIDPPLDTPVADGLAINYTPAKVYRITLDQRSSVVRSADGTVGAILAHAGIPLIGSDFSQPAEDQPAPQDGNIRVVRVSESVVLTQSPIPFQSQYVSSDQVELDHEQVLQPGQAGLAVSRTRIRYEDGQEVSRATEPEVVIRPPMDRITAYGTKIVVHTATVDGVQIQYWRAVQMFTTAYSPCNSAADRCYPGTSSGVPVQKGVVAVKYSWYLAMQGQGLYIPGYGRATIEDVCGGCVGKPWIDLGYTDAQFASEGDQWGKYVTVYFLAPPPPNILYVLQ